MVARAGPGYIPTFRIPNTQRVNLLQKITTIALSILCFTALPIGWNIAFGFGVLALGFLYPLRDRAVPGFYPTYHPPAGPISFAQPHAPAPRFPFSTIFRGPLSTTLGYAPVGGHQVGYRRPVGGGIPGRDVVPPAPLIGPIHVAGGHQIGDRRPVGGGIPGRGVAPPARPTHVAGGHQVGDRRVPGCGGQGIA